MLNKDFEYRGFCKNQKDLDLYSVKELAKKNGWTEEYAEDYAKGYVEGLAEGRAEIAIEIAKNLLATGMPVEDVVKGTGLSIEEISQL